MQPRESAALREILTDVVAPPPFPAATLPAAVLSPAVTAGLPAIRVGRAAVLAAELRL